MHRGMVSAPSRVSIAAMPNLASALKSEIARVARKELRDEIQHLRKASAQYRSDIAALKRRIATLERQVKSGSRASRRAADDDEAEGDGSPKLRFSASRLAGLRTKLGLSAEAMGKLIGVTGQSIYKWEAGKARPRAGQLPAIAAVRKLGKREAAARLEELAAT